MKIMKRMMGLAAAILALSACSESEDLLSAFHSDPNAVRITAEVGKASADGFTRSYPLGDADEQKKFKEGDMISVQADGQDAVTYQLVGTEWQPQGGKFLKWESNEMNFTAYYPASFDGNLNNVTLPAEYDEASLAANDFMSYSGKQSNTKGNQLSLIMERKMARVVVEIAGFNDQYAEATVNSLSICGIKAYKHDNKYYALIKPCEAQSSATFLSLEVAEGESKTTTEKLTGIPALTAGNSYTYKLKVGKNKVSVSGITVKKWTTGEITGCKAEYKAPPYVTFTANEEQTFIMSAKNSYEIPGLEYSVNNGTWKKVVTGEAVTFGGSKGTLSLRGKNNPEGTSKQYSGYSQISFGNTDVNVACTGDIRTLLDYTNYKDVATKSARFRHLFEDCTQLTSAPDLPAKTLADGCYSYMFSGCSKLETGPKELPATTLADDCYSHMFYRCSKLETGPIELPATTLAESCYMGMFRECTNLKNVPDELPAKTMFKNCYFDMFTGCTSLEGGPKLPATTLAESCYKNMFEGCTKLKTAPELKAMSLKKSCYHAMFWGCTSLTAAPDLPATELVEYCYTTMFYGCKNLKTGPVKLPALKLATRCYDSMFLNCSSLQTAPDLPATELAEYCYNGMFCGCKNLSSVKMLAPSAQIKSVGFSSWLSSAGTSAASRTLIVQDEAAYNALVNAGLPAKWQTDQCTVGYAPKQ